MLRHLQLLILCFTFLSSASAFSFPDGFLLGRQVGAGTSALLTGGSTGTESSATTGSPETQVTTTVATNTPTTAATQSPTVAASPATEVTQTTLQPTGTTISQTGGQTTIQQTTGQVTSSPSRTTLQTITSNGVTQTTESTISSGTTITSAPTTSIIDSSSTIGTDASIPPTSTMTSTDLAAIPVKTITYTSNGHVLSSIATGTQTAIPTSSGQPSLADGGDNGQSSISSVAKKVIGGIVGGIGGALLIAGIAFVVYRMWGRKKVHKVPQDDGMAYFSAGSTDSIERKKSAASSPGGDGWGKSSLTSKFSEPLDRYKSPGQQSSGGGAWGSVAGGRSNVASNF